MSNSQEQEQPKKELRTDQVLLEKIAKGLASSSHLPMLGQGFEIFNVNEKFAAVNKNFRTRLLTLVENLKNAGSESSAQVENLSNGRFDQSEIKVDASRSVLEIRYKQLFDQSEIKVDARRPSLETRYKQLFGESLVMVVSKNSKADSILPFRSIMSRRQKVKKHPLAEKIWKSLKNWATPYDSYLVEITSKQGENEPPKKRKKLNC